MSEQVSVEEGSTSFLEMSDEELMAFDPTSLPTSAPAAAEVVAPVVPDDENEDLDLEEDDGKEHTGEEGNSGTAENVETPGNEGDAADGEEVGQAATDAAPESESVQEGEQPAGIDYKAEYERLLKPFKANGRDIAVSNVDDAVALMQMGANYNKKMAGLKPNLRILKMLENVGLLDEAKLSYLIDLDKKNPEAISKLVKDSGLDPLDLDAEKAGGYKPNTYSVDEREIELDTVLDELQSSPAYNRTLEIVSKQWDGASKQVIVGAPQLLKLINSHVESGIYDQISKEIENERVFGRLDGLSDLEAYRQVGDAIQARGGFAHLGRQGQQTPAAPVIVAPKPKKADDDKLREKKRAASSTKSAGSSATPQVFNPLALSDEEFSKTVNPKFL